MTKFVDLQLDLDLAIPGQMTGYRISALIFHPTASYVVSKCCSFQGTPRMTETVDLQLDIDLDIPGQMTGYRISAI